MLVRSGILFGVALLVAACAVNVWDKPGYITRKGVVYWVQMGGDSMNMIVTKDLIPTTADYLTFKPIKKSIAIGKDKQNVYCYGKVIPGADAASFKMWDYGSYSYYYRDRNSVYRICERLEGVDPEDFTATSFDRGYTSTACYEGSTRQPLASWCQSFYEY